MNKKIKELKTIRQLFLPVLILLLFAPLCITDSEKEILKLAEEIASLPGSHRKNDVYLMVADYFFSKRKYNEAIEYYKKVKPKKEILSELDLLVQRTNSELDKLREKESAGTTLKKDEISIKYWELAKLESINEQVKLMLDPEIYSKFQIGCCYFELKDFNSAEKIYNELISSASDEKTLKDSYTHLILCYTKSKRFEEAKKRLSGLKDAPPAVKEISDKLEFILLSGLAEEKLYNEIIKEFEGGTFTFLKILETEKLDEKKTEISKEKEEKKQIIENTYNQALKFYKKGEMLRATEILNDTIKKYPEESKKLKSLLTDIKTDVESQLLRFVSKEKTYYARAYLAYYEGKLKEAISFWNKVLEENPNNEEVIEFINKLKTKEEINDKKIKPDEKKIEEETEETEETEE